MYRIILALIFSIYASSAAFAGGQMLHPNDVDHPPQIQQEEKRPSYWGYHHHGLHQRGIIDQMQKAQQPNKYHSCCSGVDSGECRVTEVNMKDKQVLIDGEWVTISPDAKIVIVEGLNSDEQAVVCASSAGYGEGPTSYCIGLGGGQ